MDLKVVQDVESQEFDVIDMDQGGVLVDMGFQTEAEAETWITWIFETDDVICRDDSNVAWG